MPELCAEYTNTPRVSKRYLTVQRRVFLRFRMRQLGAALAVEEVNNMLTRSLLFLNSFRCWLGHVSKLRSKDAQAPDRPMVACMHTINFMLVVNLLTGP